MIVLCPSFNYKPGYYC
uniref:Uncharacterized protein n=1 Tax=Anguilla anguilla TaxID=7936 RepID=A0A0E9PNM4_ANGAN